MTIVEMKLCGGCGTNNVLVSSFCIECGIKLEDYSLSPQEVFDKIDDLMLEKQWNQDATEHYVNALGIIQERPKSRFGDHDQPKDISPEIMPGRVRGLKTKNDISFKKGIELMKKQKPHKPIVGNQNIVLGEIRDYMKSIGIGDGTISKLINFKLKKKKSITKDSNPGYRYTIEIEIIDKGMTSIYK